MLPRYALFATLSIALPAVWYVAYRAWFESGTGPIYSYLAPRSAFVLWFPLLSIATAWWFVVPKPRVQAPKLAALGIALPFGLVVGIFIGLWFTCTNMNKCM